VIAGHDGDGVGAERFEPALDPREGRMDAQDEVAVLGPGAGQQLGRVGARERADEHRVSPRPRPPPRPGFAAPSRRDSPTISSNARSASARTSSRVSG
jgi:hypothetical protein